MTRLRWGSATDVGMVRDVNQDSLLLSERLFAVADGMGGHQGGEVASATALEILERTFGDSATHDDLLEAVRKANAKVWDKAQLDESLHGMGTTLTAIASLTSESGDEKLAVVNVGDSRAYILRDDGFEQLTSDHSFVEEMVRAGELSREDAESHPKRNILTRAVGVEPTVEAEIVELRPEPGDRLLLCSDGLVRELTDDQVSAVLRRLKNPDEAARELITQAKAHGGHDNITVIVIDVEGDDGTEVSNPVEGSRSRGPVVTPKPKAHGRAATTARVALFIGAAGVLLGVGIGAVVWYARSSYFVGLEGEQLVIYKGRPDSVLWYEATVAQRTNVLTSDVLPSALPALREGALQSSLAGARNYIENLENEAAEARRIAGPNRDDSVIGSQTGDTTTTTIAP